MNEFTKEELETIYCHMENEPLELMNKVKYMIDNYCDHEQDGTLYLTTPHQFKCYKCGEFYQ